MAKKLQDILKAAKGEQKEKRKPGKSRAEQIIDLVKKAKVNRIAYIDEVYITDDGQNYKKLDEGRKWISGRFERNIGIDQPTSGAGMKHGHVLGRKDNEIVVVNVDGSGSHGTKGRLHRADAEALRNDGFTIRSDRIVEWIVIGTVLELLID